MTPEQERILAQANQLARVHTALRGARAALGDDHPLAAKLDEALVYGETAAGEDFIMGAMLLSDALARGVVRAELGEQWVAHAETLARKWGA